MHYLVVPSYLPTRRPNIIEKDIVRRWIVPSSWIRQVRQPDSMKAPDQWDEWRNYSDQVALKVEPGVQEEIAGDGSETIAPRAGEGAEGAANLQALGSEIGRLKTANAKLEAELEDKESIIDKYKELLDDMDVDDDTKAVLIAAGERIRMRVRAWEKARKDGANRDDGDDPDEQQEAATETLEGGEDTVVRSSDLDQEVRREYTPDVATLHSAGIADSDEVRPRPQHVRACSLLSSPDTHTRYSC